jgi:hypothetical protein
MTRVNSKYFGQLRGPQTTAWEEFRYPSSAALAGEDLHKYHWSAVCRPLDARQIHMTVFVARKISSVMQYYSWGFVSGVPMPGQSSWPSPVPVRLEYEGNPVQLKVLEARNSEWGPSIFGFFGDTTVLVDDVNGKLYRVIEYKPSVLNGPRDTLVLQDPWQWDGFEQDPTAAPPAGPLTRRFWIVPPGVGSTRNPVIGVVQKTVTFEN